MMEAAPAIGDNSRHFGETLVVDAPSPTDLAREFWAFVEVIRNSGMPAAARHVALDIWLHMRPGRLSAHPSAARIARNTGLSERTVKKYISDLQKASLFAVESGGGRAQTNTYRAIIPVKTLQELHRLTAQAADETVQMNAKTVRELHRLQSETVQLTQQTVQPTQQTVQLTSLNGAPVAQEATLEASEKLLGSNGLRYALPTPSPTASRSELIEVNGVSINGPGFVLPYGSIDMEATLRGVPIELARALAISLAEGWAVNKHRPGGKAVAEFIRALREEANDKAIQSYKAQKFANHAGGGEPGRPPGIPDKVWKAMCQERRKIELNDAR